MLYELLRSHTPTGGVERFRYHAHFLSVTYEYLKAGTRTGTLPSRLVLSAEVGVALRVGFGLGLGLGLNLGLSLGFGCSFGGSLGVCEDPVGGQRPARL